MKQTSKDKIINESIADKIQIARQLKKSHKYYDAIEAYHRVLFLKEDPYFMLELAEIYQRMYDLSSAILFYRRVFQLNGSSNAEEKVKQMTKIQGLQLLKIGSVKNILEDTEFEPFIKRYSAFHKKLIKRIAEKQIFSDYLESGLAYLEVNQRQLALNEIENCILIDDKDVDLIVLRALLNWSLMENEKGYKQFWNAYAIDKTHPEVQFFVQMITPELQRLYKQAKYDLIERKIQKCKLKVKKGLEIHPYHTEFLILSAYIHRSKEEYELALADLDLANKHFEDPAFADQLRNQISLTYNEMGIYFYRQAKYNEAITLFTEGLTFKSQDWGMYTNRGDCYKAISQYVKALQDYLKAYQFQKKNDELNLRISSIYSVRGVALFNSKNYQMSLQEFEESIRYSPKSAPFFLSKAKCLLQLNRKNEAVDALQNCLSLDDKISEAVQLMQQLKEPEQKKVKNSRKVIYLSKEK